MQSVKELLKKELQRANHEELQTVLFEIEMFIKNRPLNYIYPTDLEACLTLAIFYLDVITYESINFSAYSNRLHKIINQFWDRWKKEYVVKKVNGSGKWNPKYQFFKKTSLDLLVFQYAN